MIIYFRIIKIFLSPDIFGQLFGRVTATGPPFGPISQCCQLSWFYTYCLGKLLVVYALIYSFCCRWVCSLLYIDNLVSSFSGVCKAVPPERVKWVGNTIVVLLYNYTRTRSLGALRAPTSSLRPFGPPWLRPSRPSGAQAVCPLRLKFCHQRTDQRTRRF